jgi:polysaccharide biosynthesis protein VpsQ
MKITWMTGIYVLLLMGIIYLADNPQYQELFSLIRNVPGGDKCGHFLLMGLLSFLLNTSLHCREVNVRAKHVLLGSVVVSIAVTLEEVSQIFIQYRSFDSVDLLFDYLGIWVFGNVALYIRARCNLKPGGVV